MEALPICWDLLTLGRNVASGQRSPTRRRRAPAATPRPPTANVSPAPNRSSRLCGPVRGRTLTGFGAGAGAGAGTPAAPRTAGSVAVVVGAAVVVVVGGAVVVVGGGGAASVVKHTRG